MTLLEQLASVRRPLYKRVTGRNIPADNKVKELAISNKLTREYLLCSQGDPFILAYYYNELFEIREYLEHLRGEEMTNVTYNVIKQYLKGESRSTIDALTARRVDDTDFTASLMMVLRGELYRISGYRGDEDGLITNTFVFWGFTTLLSNYFDNFEVAFRSTVSRMPDIVELLDLENERVQRMIREHQSVLFDYLKKSEMLGSLFPLLDTGRMNVFEMYSLMKEYVKGGDDIKICAVKKIISDHSGELLPGSFCKVLRGILMVFYDSSFKKVNMVIYEYIKDSLLRMEEKCVELDSDVGDDELQSILSVLETTRGKDAACLLYSVLSLFSYYNIEIEYTRLRLPESIINKLISTESVDINNMLIRIRSIKEKQDAFKTVLLAALFHHFKNRPWNTIPDINQILDLPDKFLILALERINTPISQLILNLHTNIHKSRIKDKIVDAIKENKNHLETFISYLIMRHIWYDIDMSEYANQMSDRYKMIYAENNLEWAINNLSELRRIGLTWCLYSKLKRTSYSNLLNEGDRPKEELIAEVEEKPKLVWDIETKYEPKRLCSDITMLRNAVDTARVEEQSNLKVYPEATRMVEVIYTQLREPDADCTECSRMLLESTSSYEGYVDSITVLFNWLKTTGSANKLPFLVSNTVTKYSNEVLLSDFQAIIHFYIHSPHISTLISSVAFSLSYSEFTKLINSDTLNITVLGVKEGVVDAFSKRTRNPEYLEELKELTVTLLNPTLHITKVLLGVAFYKSLPDTHKPDISLILSILALPSDEVLSSALSLLPPRTYTSHLLPIIFTRNILDDLAAELIKKLDINSIPESDLLRLYSIFQASPLLYIKHDLSQYGLVLDESIALELISLLSITFDHSLFSKIAFLFNKNDRVHFRFTEKCYSKMISKLNDLNHLYKNWVLDQLAGVTITAPWFIKLCHLIGNEVDINLISKGLTILKNGLKEDKIVSQKLSSWMGNPKLKRLVRRVYPLKKDADPELYRAMLRDCDEDEARMLIDVHRYKI